MKDVKELFDQAENGVLSYDQFMQLAKANNAKFVDLSEGGYVSKNKFDAELEAKVKEIETLTGTISTRNTDLETLKRQLEAAGADVGKLNDLTSQLQALQAKYDTDSKNYKKQLEDQAYEFAVREFAATKDFSSKAAKRDFIQSMIAKQLKMDGSSILGAEDFVKSYMETNEDAFIQEYDDYDDADYEEDYEDPQPEEYKPQFVGPTGGAADYNSPDPTNGFANAFHFTPIRPINDD